MPGSTYPLRGYAFGKQLFFGHFKKLKRLLALNAWEGVQELVECVSGLDEIKQSLRPSDAEEFG